MNFIVLHITIVICFLFCRMWVVKTMTATVGHLCFRLVTSPHSPNLNIGNLWTNLLSKSHHTLQVKHACNMMTYIQSSGTVILEDQLNLCLCLQRWQCVVRVYIKIYVYFTYVCKIYVNLLLRQKTNSVLLRLTCN